ncbi:hypothetical protein [Oceanihabitans sediminis]|uniref:Rieske domain-containing protein n=1 Tax=Oceanihabitans sediminis TaxID=1812012 RepID=A0A368P8E8_9FLAO|nr:hypothetical protein [Oceanihabitans sediminis]MDX1277588.1 hypothetical protein [Oceanihabitans sediminis]MDX1773237.1 hypothetical protein [Oceanihabitans sediminis]RBP34930.1 hypothetical protein DFR65_101830 [Oceanihabitans sediminis]RCU58570.1 hypothetical protein DU428_04110 [Oceanihabitans sediminis]
MKKIFLATLACVSILACSKSDNDTYNQYIPDQAFDTTSTINTSFPQFNSLKYPGNHVVVQEYGINGIVVYYSGSTYLAFELSDPNHHLQSCSKLTVEGVIASCNCDDGNTYDILTGQPNSGTSAQFGLKQYHTEVSGNIIRVYNN